MLTQVKESRVKEGKKVFYLWKNKIILTINKKKVRRGEKEPGTLDEKRWSGVL